jgi:predicted ATPase with chaperone activity
VLPRIAAARAVQLVRFGPACPNPVNAAMAHEDLRRHCRLDPPGQRLLDDAFENRALDRRILG